VKRDLQLGVSALKTLVTSPALQSDGLTLFDKRAGAFLPREPPGTLSGLVPATFAARQITQPIAQLRRLAAHDDSAEGEQRFRTLFERPSSGTVLQDPETTQIIDCNEAVAGQTLR